MITRVKCDPLRFGTSIALIDGKKVNLAVAKMKAYFIDKQDRTHIRTHRHYFLKVRTRYTQPQTYQSFQFAVCELLNFLNVVLQILFLDIFFDGVFTNYGTGLYVHHHSKICRHDSQEVRFSP